MTDNIEVRSHHWRIVAELLWDKSSSEKIAAREGLCVSQANPNPPNRAELTRQWRSNLKEAYDFYRANRDKKAVLKPEKDVICDGCPLKEHCPEVSLEDDNKAATLFHERVQANPFLGFSRLEEISSTNDPRRMRVIVHTDMSTIKKTLMPSKSQIRRFEHSQSKKKRRKKT